jgi:hypothetical protein
MYNTIVFISSLKTLFSDYSNYIKPLTLYYNTVIPFIYITYKTIKSVINPFINCYKP